MTAIIDWLEQSSLINPDKIAFADPNTSISYNRLVDYSKRIGTALARAVEPRRPVAIFVDKSTSAIYAAFGAVYAGCCYSFIDLRQPAQRIELILRSLDPACVLVDDSSVELASEVFQGNVNLLKIESLRESDKDETVLQSRRKSSYTKDPLYINFTSGSTGTPKGVAISHESVIDFIPVFTETLGLTSKDVFANQAPLDFDVSVKDIFSAIYLGATVHLIPREYFSIPIQLMDYLDERQPTVLIWAVSAMCFVSIMRGFDYKIPTSIRLVAFSGEVMPIKQLKIWQKNLPETQFINVYGPTEITCNCTYYFINREFELTESIPIGKPFKNERVFLLDELGNEINDSGFDGEIYVGGACVALGYYAEPEKTEAAFVQNPLNDKYRDIVYKTGDLARYDNDGNLVYVSRIDHQIKHMGQRIELTEIETVANSIDGVSQSCCIYNSKRKRIRMFYTGSAESEKLRNLLAEALPPYMLPNTITHLDVLPLSKNGKIDRVKLAERQ